MTAPEPEQQATSARASAERIPEQEIQRLLDSGEYLISLKRDELRSECHRLRAIIAQQARDIEVLTERLADYESAAKLCGNVAHCDRCAAMREMMEATQP